MKSQEKTREKKTDRNSPELPNQSENSKKIVPESESKPKNISSFNDGIDADLEEALRRSLADQSGSSQPRAANGKGKRENEATERCMNQSI